MLFTVLCAVVVAMVATGTVVRIGRSSRTGWQLELAGSATMSSSCPRWTTCGWWSKPVDRWPRRATGPAGAAWAMSGSAPTHGDGALPAPSEPIIGEADASPTMPATTVDDLSLSDPADTLTAAVPEALVEPEVTGDPGAPGCDAPEADMWPDATGDEGDLAFCPSTVPSRCSTSPHPRPCSVTR